MKFRWIHVGKKMPSAKFQAKNIVLDGDTGI